MVVNTRLHAEGEAVKFHEIPIGQRFSFEGEIYAKTGPVMAVCERDGARRLMRRSSEVTLAAAETATPGHEQSAADAPLTRGQVLLAFERFSELCYRCLHEMAENGDTAKLEDVRRALQRGQSEFVAALSRDDRQ